MRYWLFAAAIALTGPVVAAEATPEWQFYETDGLLQAFVQSADGSQLILKCDKPGKGSVYAAMIATKPIANPAAKFTVRPVSLRYDAGDANDDHWRYFGKMATAVDKTGERSLTRFLIKLATAKKVDIRLDPEGRSATGTTTSSAAPSTFDVHDAGAAIDKIYASCKDTRPAV